MGEPIVQLSHVRLGYGPKVVLEDVNLTLEEGDFLGLVGPNGSGKTTLLRALLGQLRPQAGQVRYGPPPRPRTPQPEEPIPPPAPPILYFLFSILHFPSPIPPGSALATCPSIARPTSFFP